MGVMNALAPRIGQLVRMLSSDKDGEIINAVHALGRTLRAAGFDWDDLANTAERHLATPARTSRPDWQVTAQECLRRGGYGLRPAELEFLQSISTWPTPPSEKQLRWLDAIAAVLNVEEMGA